MVFIVSFVFFSFRAHCWGFHLIVLYQSSSRVVFGPIYLINEINYSLFYEIIGAPGPLDKVPSKRKKTSQHSPSLLGLLGLIGP